MAKLEDLIQQIADERLRKEISLEVRDLKSRKNFGLVFEEHLPESIRENESTLTSSSLPQGVP